MKSTNVGTAEYRGGFCVGQGIPRVVFDSRIFNRHNKHHNFFYQGVIGTTTGIQNEL